MILPPALLRRHVMPGISAFVSVPRLAMKRPALPALRRAAIASLALVTLATALPVVGGPIWVAVACLGVGALAWRLARPAGAVRSSEA